MGSENLTKLGLVAGHFSKHVYFGPLVVGIESGFFRENGFDLKVIETAGGGESLRVLSASDEMMVTVGSPAASIKAILAGEKLKIVANWTHAAEFWVVLNDSALKTIEDLKGKKLGFTRPGSVTHLQIQMILEKAGFPKDSVTIMPVGGVTEIWTSLKAGFVDCGFMIDPFGVKLRSNREARILFRSIDYLPDLSTGWFVVKESFLKQKPEVIKKWLLTVEKSAKRFLDKGNINKVAALWAKGTKFEADSLLGTIENTPSSLYNLGFTPEMLKQTEEGMRRFKMISEPVPWSRIIDQSFLPERHRIELPD
jgi:NitT/TauT family transport system substrate-binding protein